MSNEKTAELSEFSEETEKNMCKEVNNSLVIVYTVIESTNWGNIPISSYSNLLV